MIAKSLARPLILATDLGGSPDRRLCLRCARRIAPRSSSVRFRIASRSCGTRSSSALLVCPKSRLLATGENGACLVPWYVKCTTHTARGLRSTRYKGATCRGLHSAFVYIPPQNAPKSHHKNTSKNNRRMHLEPPCPASTFVMMCFNHKNKRKLHQAKLTG